MNRQTVRDLLETLRPRPRCRATFPGPVGTHRDYRCQLAPGHDGDHAVADFHWPNRITHGHVHALPEKGRRR